MHEQAHTFFVSIWLHAMIVSPEAATRLGWTMLTLRGLYPITWALEGDHPTIRGPGSICVFCVAMPMIAISIYLLAMSAAVLNDVDLRAKLVEYEAGRYFSRHFDFERSLGAGAGPIGDFERQRLRSGARAVRWCFRARVAPGRRKPRRSRRLR